MYGATTLGVIGYLAGNISTVAGFALLWFGMLCPTTALISRLSMLRGLPAGERVLVSCVATLLAATPWYYVRRISPWPLLADIALLSVVWAGVLLWRVLPSFFRDLRESMQGLAPALPFLWLPILFGMVWAGFAVDRGDSIAFYGLYPPDLGNFASKVSMIRLSSGLPPDPVIGMPDPFYHWFYLTIPAWLVDLSDGSTRVSNALVLCNSVIAFLLMLALAQVVRRSVTDDRHRWTISTTVGVVLFAPLATYAHQIIGRYLHAPWVLEPRNQLLLSLVNSMTVFGNNSLALLIIISAVLMLRHWNASGRIGHGLLISLLLVCLPGYSATLVLPVGLAFLAWFLLGKVTFPLRALLIAAPMAIAGWIVLHAAHVLGGVEKVGFSFDQGHFLANFGLSAAPLWATALLAGRQGFRMEPWFLICVAALAVPTCVVTVGSGTMPSDLSMKTCTLLIVSMAPMVARGIDVAMKGTLWKSKVIWPVFVLLLCGLINTIAYAGQFLAYRALNDVKRAQLLPAGYDAALNYLRTTSSTDAVLLDTVGVEMPYTLWPASLAERRVLLPNKVWMTIFVPAYPEIAAKLEARLSRYREWQTQGYPPGNLSDEFAAQSDYLILPQRLDLEPAWTVVKQFRDHWLYESRRVSGQK